MSLTDIFCYIECYYADGTQILGNLDGQAVIRTPNYRRTTAYARIKQIVGNPKHMNGIVQSARIVRRVDNKVLEVITPCYNSPSSTSTTPTPVSAKQQPRKDSLLDSPSISSVTSSDRADRLVWDVP